MIRRDRRIFFLCLLFAFLLEGSFIYLSGFQFPSSARHVHEDNLPPAEMEVVTLPEEAPQLKSEEATPSTPEETLSKNQNSTAPSDSQKSLSEPAKNITVKGKPLSPTHGPVLVESPAPVIPEYLKNQDLNTKVVIEFTVLASGEAKPRLLVSSGNEELDQIALTAAKKWKFYPAENNHQAISASVRLRILFEVK